MGKSAVYMARKRVRAQAAGLCLTCCKEKPAPDRSICASCNKARHQRLRRSSEYRREYTESQRIIQAHERAGDTLVEHYLYADAIQHYRNALSVQAISPKERAAISKKLSKTSFLVDAGFSQETQSENIFPLHGELENSVGAAEALLQRARHLRFNFNTRAALHTLKRALHIVRTTNAITLRRKTVIEMANHLCLTARYDTAHKLLRSVGEPQVKDEAAHYHLTAALIATARGEVSSAHENFERAIRYATSATDSYGVLSAWGSSAYSAMVLGDIERAKECVEQALFVARRVHAMWLIPWYCIVYAQVLFIMGYYGSALDYLREALSYDVHVPMLEERIVSIGIPIALYSRDEALLKRCVRPGIIEDVFRSQAAHRICAITAAFVKLYASRGESHRGHALIRRALKAVSTMDDCVDFPLVVARYGRKADIAPAKILLERRTNLPSSEVSRSCLELFEAFTENREDHPVKVHAQRALGLFERLGWRAYAEEARQLLTNTSTSAQTAGIGAEPFVHTHASLTEREREVAALVLKGLTSREIAEKLSIGSRTVDAHVTSIMNRLGIRSRHQFAYFLKEESV